LKRLCRCGRDISDYSPSLRMCYRCRVTCDEPKRCDGCGDNHHRRMSRHCEPCARARWLFSAYASGRHAASVEVAVAKRTNALPHPSIHLCEDCGKTAECYDHRDYGRPLDVAAVCLSCNLRRKSGAPRRWTFDEFMAWAKVGKRARAVFASRPEAIERLKRNHFNGPGGVACEPLRSAA
jgi:hypothetical protein